MKKEHKSELIEFASKFSLPRYHEIPDVGLFLEQVTKYIAMYLDCLPGISLTGSMISNYVKKDIIDNPVKKQYGRQHIAYLIFAAVAKSVLSLEQVKLLFEMQTKSYPADVAYNYFCDEFENVLGYVFGANDTLKHVGQTDSDEKVMLRNTIITVAHKVYLEMVFQAIVRDMEEE